MKLSDNMKEALGWVPNDWGSWPLNCYVLTQATWAALERRGLVERISADETLIRKTAAGRAVFR